MDEPPILVIPHPFSSKTNSEVDALVHQIFPRIQEMLKDPPRSAPRAAEEVSNRASRIDVPRNNSELHDFFWQRMWSEGLPVVPPDEASVARMLEAVELKPDTLLGIMPPRKGAVLAEKVAANAVMAGALPEHMPVILAATKACLRPQFGIGGVAATTGGAAPVIVVNGPLSRELDFPSSSSCFSLAHRASAVVARSLKFIIRNLGGAVPGELDRSTHGFPGKAVCFAEDELESPWEPLHVEMGCSAGESAVTLFGVRGMHQSTENHGGRVILDTLAGSMRAWGLTTYYIQNAGPQLLEQYGMETHPGRVLVVICPELAEEIDKAGFAKSDVKKYLFEHARIPKRDLEGHGNYGGRNWPSWMEQASRDELMPMVSKPEGFMVVVAGGPGRHCAWFPLWPSTFPVTEKIQSFSAEKTKGLKESKLQKV